MADRVLIIGCGYVGFELAMGLQGPGVEVTGWVHTHSSAFSIQDLGLARIIVGSVGDAAVWRAAGDDYAFVVHCASSRGGGEFAYDEVFRRGAERMTDYAKKARKLFVSSTSVYGQVDGEVVTEESAAEPGTATGRILREAERIALAGGATVLRSSGIYGRGKYYGPGRGGLLDKLRRGEAVIEGDGARWMNQVHKCDLVAALIHAREHARPGEIYNATDDTPVTQRDYYTWCAQFLGVPLPPTGPVNTQRKRGLTNKRVSNAKLRATGWAPQYPSFREGIAANHSPK
jgi:nucleoside-diphosphate-sugar epimerase